MRTCLPLLLAFVVSQAIAQRPPPERAFKDSPAVAAAKAEGLTAQLQTLYSMKSLLEGTYVGSEYCIACHQDYATWRDTKHAQALRRPMVENSLIPGKGVVADYDDNGVDDFVQGLDFNQISSVFDPYKPNAPVLSYQDGAYAIRIGEATMPLVCTQGGTGDWKQRYLVRVPVTDTTDGYSSENYVSPVQFNEATSEYVLYHAEAWYDDNNQPRFNAQSRAAQVAAENGRSYSKKCIGCHTTGVRGVGQDANGEWNYRAFPATLFRRDDPGYFDYDHDGITDIVNVGCEACHGPGSQHILGAGDPERIVNPEKLDTPQANEVCGQCHMRAKSTPNGDHDWPYDDENGVGFLPGGERALASFFIDASGRWPDGVNSRQHHQQYFDFLESPKPGFRFHPVKCVECHDSHGHTSNQHLIRDVLIEDDIPVPTRVENNSLCLTCHATHGPFSEITVDMVADFEGNRSAIAEIVSAHTRHPFAPERSMGLSRCTKCHNPEIAKSAINYDIHSHSFEAIPPEKTLAFQEEGGMPNSCDVSCHAQKANIFGLGIDENISDWSEDFNRNSAEILMRFYGPEGLWWQHSLDEGEE